MTSSLQLRDKATWRLRFSALVCLFLLLFASTAQVVHHHTGELPLKVSSAHSGQQQQALAPRQAPQQKDAEALCPLCIAMHAVLPVAAQVVSSPLERATEVHSVPVASRYSSLWRFDLFGRPPPVLPLAS